RISSCDPSLDPESITISSQFEYSWACTARNVSPNAHASLNERMMILTIGSLTVTACRITAQKQWNEYPLRRIRLLTTNFQMTVAIYYSSPLPPSPPSPSAYTHPVLRLCHQESPLDSCRGTRNYASRR